tara:strand:- start:32 stop:142 length:111 start_codon:yes stop_codon:yes gene_type:complete
MIKIANHIVDIADALVKKSLSSYAARARPEPHALRA